MKGLIKIVLSSITLVQILTSCSKNEDVSGFTESPVITQKTSQRIQALKFSGHNGGKTSFYKDGNLTGKRSTSDFFISQSPLVEFKFEIDIQYDSITEYEIDSVSQDTVSINSYLEEVSRDTVGFETGPAWFPLDYQNFTSIVVGLPSDINDTTKLFVKVEHLDSLAVEQNGLLFTAFGEEGTQNLEGQRDGGDTPLIIVYDNFMEVTDEFAVTHENVPIYNEMGIIDGTSEGIRFNGFFLRNFLIENLVVDRKLRLTFKLSDGRAVSHTFELKFVEENVYHDRQCWLNGSEGCEDLF